MAEPSRNPVAVVTGGSRGIGRAICLELARLGHAVVVNYASRRDAADEVVSLIQSSGGHATAVQADVAQRNERQRLIGTAMTEFGQLDVLVNNAGIASPGARISSKPPKTPGTRYSQRI